MRFALLPCALTISIIAGILLSENRPAKNVNSARLLGNYFVTADNARLPAHVWLPNSHPPKAVIVALHGFNDYGNFFTGPGDYFKDLGIASYAYDQRGFGGAPGRGYWAGIQVYAHDLSEFIRLIRERHPGVPLYLLGESMGAAEVIVAMTGNSPPLADGLILSAPAVWGWQTVPGYQRAGLWMAAHTVPWLRLTGASLHLVPSDNIEMLRALSRDPLVIKETRIDTIYGLADLMNRAFEQAKRLDKLTLVLYGECDEIVSKPSVYRMLNTLPPNRKWRVAFYENGYHLLLRDLEAPKLWRDIAAWIDNPSQRLPSGADRRAMAVLARGHP
jgi:alpha-beta hydrolase superfamily lysophospholipase